jgi:hypothetical protein
MEQVLLAYGPLGVSVLALGWYVLQQAKEIKALYDKRLEDYKLVIEALNTSTSSIKDVVRAMEAQGQLIETTLKLKRTTK